MPHARRLLSVLWVARLAIPPRPPPEASRSKKGYVSYHITASLGQAAPRSGAEAFVSSDPWGMGMSLECSKMSRRSIRAGRAGLRVAAEQGVVHAWVGQNRLNCNVFKTKFVRPR